MKDVTSGRAISIQQPFIEEILVGKKKYEYRSRQTHIRGRVYLYASKKPGELSRWKKAGFVPGELPTGLIVGSVEIVDCVYIDKFQCMDTSSITPRDIKKLYRLTGIRNLASFFLLGKPSIDLFAYF